MAGRLRRTSVGWYFFPAARPASSRAGGTPTTARSGAGRSSSTTRTAADPPACLCLHEVGAAGQVDQVRLEPRWAAQKVRHLVELVEDVARLAAPHRPLEGLVVAVEHVLVAKLVEHDLELFAGPLEDLPEFDGGRVGDVDLVAHAPEKRLVDERSRLEVGTEDDHSLEGGADRHTGASERQIVDASLEGDNQPIQQGAWRRVLAAEVIEQEDAAIGFEMDGRFVVAPERVEGGRQLRRGQLATGLDEGTLDQHPPRVEVQRHLPLDPLVVERVVETHHLSLDVDRIRDEDRLTQQLGAGFGDSGLPVARRAIKK